MIIASCIGTLGNIRPTVFITSPLNGTVFNTRSVTVATNARDADGTISKVEFYNGSSLLGTVTQPPYSLTLNNIADGSSYSVLAKAYDNQNAYALSNTVNFSIDIPADTCRFTSKNADFTVTMTGKANPTITFIPGSPIAGCQYVIVNLKLNGNGIGGWYMTKSGTRFTSTVTAKINDKLEAYFTYQTPPAGERNSSLSPITATVGCCGATAVNTPRMDENFSLYPNPTKGNIVISVAGLTGFEHVRISITDITGKLVYQETKTANELGQLTNTLMLEAKIPAGLYFITVNGSVNQVRRLVIE